MTELKRKLCDDYLVSNSKQHCNHCFSFFIVFLFLEINDVLLMNIVEFCNALSKACIPHTNTPLQSFVDDKLPCNIHLKKKKTKTIR